MHAHTTTATQFALRRRCSSTAARLLAAEVGADPRATFAALDRMMREHLEYLADMPLGSFGDGA